MSGDNQLAVHWRNQRRGGASSLLITFPMRLLGGLKKLVTDGALPPGVSQGDYRIFTCGCIFLFVGRIGRWELFDPLMGSRRRRTVDASRVGLFLAAREDEALPTTHGSRT